ncbi:hypothetical protein CDD81_1262 [Ophiocordyceps australis]|uniref:DUF676 domain-containing protein n=1 Tax=Ophiocordyceps australis TaxID=1399860 RepID=A0A2C5YE63_9HYPO|nr:hypothetical protein CDD81_1262 [Ophiocordyceps australis]
MLLVHQVGSLKIGEVVRYTVSYTPSQDRILPSPERLHVRIRNTSTIALRAAFVHGPYTLSVAAYPAGFSPNEKFANPRRYGVPEFEPMLKAGGSWECELTVPDTIRQSAGTGAGGQVFGKGPEHDDESASWIIELSSQVIFSTSAAVGYELVVARDPKSLTLTQSLPIVSGGQSKVPQPGKVGDLQQQASFKDGRHVAQPRGVFSRAVHVAVEDTATLWNKPQLPMADEIKEKMELQAQGGSGDRDEARGREKTRKKRKKVHLVLLTHGLHSNLSADMLFIKESIDVAARQARVDAKTRVRRQREQQKPGTQSSDATAEAHGGDADVDATKQGDEDDEDYEHVVVRGYPGNATKTERGIKYLGKRLARYVLSMTYPDQPFFPIGKGVVEGFKETAGVETDDGKHHDHGMSHHGSQHNGHGDKEGNGAHDHVKQVHKHSTIQADMDTERRHGQQRPYQITSISFVGHSLGGLVQTYAVAYIQKHSPQFFDVIKPINFIALASPFLGLSNENPLYVKFALDFGLVGRTGQDLGLTWRAPTIARSGWGALVGNLGESAHKKVYGEMQPESKPLLRILPTGPAHAALNKFRNRTVYSNVVNDGIVPLRTSCLLFLDWQGLGRVEKARRDAGLVETVVGFGWAELMGTNMTSPRSKHPPSGDGRRADEAMREVPQPPNEAMDEDDGASIKSMPEGFSEDAAAAAAAPVSANEPNHSGALSTFLNLFKSNESPKEHAKEHAKEHIKEQAKEHAMSQKQKKILRRGQTMPLDQAAAGKQQTKVTSGHELEGQDQAMTAPPKTTFFESAGDVLNPSMPSTEYIIDPTKRPRSIFHDRVYHPSDIPPPPLKKRQTSSLSRRKTFHKGNSTGSTSSGPYSTGKTGESSWVRDYDDTAHTKADKKADEVVDGSSMRVEEKIARGYHRDLSWRKVLVKLEPDAHNNIVVRRMFANAYGWPVIKHLVDAHFSDLASARMRDEDEDSAEGALDMNQPPDEHGGETKGQVASLPSSPSSSGGHGKPENAAAATSDAVTRTVSEAREALDQVGHLPSWSLQDGQDGRASSRADSVTWSERDWSDSGNESELDTGVGGKDLSKQEQPSLSPRPWNWTEKIVGKGAASNRSKSPR